MNCLRFFLILLLSHWLSAAQAQYTFMPNTRRLHLIDSLNSVMRGLSQQPATFRRDTALFYTMDRYRYHYFDVNRPFAELTRTMLVLPDSMYRLAIRNRWQTGLIIAAIRRADAISFLGDKVSAVRLYKEALYRCQQQPLPHFQAIAFINLAACFAYRKNVTKQDWQQTVGYMKQALAVAQRSNDIENIHQYYNLMGDFHVINKQYEKALPFYEAEQPLMDKHRHLSGYRTNLAYLGICYLHTNQETKALTCLNQFFKISNQYQGAYSTYLHHIVLYEIGAFYLRNKKDYKKALTYQMQYEENIDERTLFDRLGHYEAMSQIYSGLKNYTKAYQYQQRYLTVRDSLKLDETGRRLAEIEGELALQRKQNQIKTLQNQTLQQQNESQQTELIFLITALLLVTGGAGLLWQSTRLKKKAMASDLQLAQERKEANSRILSAQETESQRIAADLHDDLGGTIATLGRRLADFRQYLHEPAVLGQFDALQPLIEKSSEDLRRIAHNLMPPEFARIGLRYALRQLVQSQPKQPTRYSFVLSGPEQKLPLDIELNAYRIVSELIQNINKHARADRAAVQLLYQKDRLTITVEDDGLGNRVVTETGKPAGIGLKNSSLRAEYIGATLWRDVSEAGTLVVLTIPYPASVYATPTTRPDPVD